MEPDLWLFEKKAFNKGFSRIAGIDEAGRGPLAGPVVSAAVIIPISLQIFPGYPIQRNYLPKNVITFTKKYTILPSPLGSELLTRLK